MLSLNKVKAWSSALYQSCRHADISRNYTEKHSFFDLMI